MITVLVNHEPVDIEANASVSQLLQSIGLEDQKGTAIAVNNEIISKPLWNKSQLKDQDKITIIKATQGG